ncbi:MAG: hypothetical protein H6638_12610 [Ardenticatenales bacterium]|nr:hypothetical protein [Ardenticatenales bacterium]
MLSKIAAARGHGVHMILGANTTPDPNLLYLSRSTDLHLGQSSSSSRRRHR